jgi:ubiquinone/menaquinone biosynthesis C-methylase UbiE
LKKEDYKWDNQLDQYSTIDNISTRISFHKNFSRSHTDLNDWLWQNYSFVKCSKILDIGCGTGTFWNSKDCSVDLLSNVTFADKSASMLLETLKNTKNLICDKSYIIEDICSLSFRDNTFDFIICHSMLHYAEDKIKALKEIRRVIKNNGTIFISTPSSVNMNQIYKIIYDIDPNVPISKRQVLTFVEENAEILLHKFFRQVNKKLFCEQLIVKKPSAIIEYVKSIQVFREYKADSCFYNKLYNNIKKVISNKGEFVIDKRYALFECAI